MNTINPRFRSIFLLLIFMVLPDIVFAQSDYSFNERSIKTINTGMFVLGGWAIANMATGAYGWARFTGQEKYFHQMNLFWNTVNLTIAGFSIYNNLQMDLSQVFADEIMQKHQQTEKLLLINSALDLGYIGTGFLLKHLSENSEKRMHLLKGYGNSLILQGGFLLVFDLCFYGILRNQRLDFMNNVNIDLAPGLSRIQFVFNI